MSASVNRVILIGNLGAKPELKYLPSGQAVCEMRIATTDKWEKDGQRQERTEWHSVIAWGKTGENAAKYLDKGRAVYVEGSLQTRSWDDKTSGEKRYKTEIKAHSVVFLGGGRGDGERPSSPARKSPNPDNGHGAGDGFGGDDFGPPPGDSDIPF